jgi:superfamily II DNA/RNA helicase
MSSPTQGRAAARPNRFAPAGSAAPAAGTRTTGAPRAGGKPTARPTSKPGFKMGAKAGGRKVWEDRSERPARPGTVSASSAGDAAGAARADRPERTDRPDRPRADRPERTDRPDRPRADRPERTDRPDRPRTGRPVAGPRSDRSDRPSGQRSERPSSGREIRDGQREVRMPDVVSTSVHIPAEGAPTFAECGLPELLVSRLARRGMTHPFPIQAATLPSALAGDDVLGKAATGSGKTLGFGLPVLARLANKRSAPKRPRAMILVPTRELARQVADALEPLGHALGVSMGTVYGGVSISRQVDQLRRGYDIVVATPGRLEDLLERRAISLDDIEVAVLDEADHLSDLGFLPAMKRLLDLCPAGGQRMLFSATLDGDVDVLVKRYLHNPVLIDVEPISEPGDVVHRVIAVHKPAQKVDVTADLVREVARSLVFVRTKHGADRLAEQLSRAGINAGAIHGGLNQNQRTRALKSFTEGSLPVLVATDVAARGIHVDGIDLVIHADPPAEAKTFAHRSGRTGRAGATGTVVTLVLPDQRRDVERMLASHGVKAS